MSIGMYAECVPEIRRITMTPRLNFAAANVKIRASMTALNRDVLSGSQTKDVIINCRCLQEAVVSLEKCSA